MGVGRELLAFFMFTGSYHQKHCERTAFLTGAGLVALIASIVIMFRYDFDFGQNLSVLFGLSVLGGAIGFFVYRFQHKKFPFN